MNPAAIAFPVFLSMAFFFGTILPANAGPLHAAAIRGNVPEVSRLLKSDANPNDRHGDGTTPLHWVAWGGYQIERKFVSGKVVPVGGRGQPSGDPSNLEAVAKLLVQAGADVNAQNPLALGTPLHNAAFHGNVPVAKVLLAHGANVKAKRNDGVTALDLASQGGHAAMVDLLRKAENR